MSFLKAEWRKLAIANYEVDSSLLTDFLPYGTELDFWKDRCYVSLVGFMFLNTRLLHFKVPFHVNFEEVNLRFYVRRFENNAWKRGVVFIKEIVPKPALALVANTIYKENYETLPMKHAWSETETERLVEYSWQKNSKWYTFRVKASRDAAEIAPGCETEFITEHYWGYAKAGNTRTNEYEVTHPRWNAYEVLDYTIDVDFEDVYGAAFSFLNKQTLVSVMLAEGSEITVENKKSIRK
ncbi:YqjF family protein [Pontibacter chitinilyticus]|uniref:YqjF family protein n=1 Tax=Pontibacter chitinilyticus TaxID=2674989 RepID=UPI00321AA56A